MQFSNLDHLQQNWSAPFTISPNNNHNAVKPNLAVAPNGDLFAIWIDNNSQSVQVSSKRGRSSWSTPVALSVAGQSINSPQLAFDLAGNATVVWSRSNGTNHTIQAVQQVNGQSWSSPADLSKWDQDAISPDLAIDPLGNILVVWQRNDSIYTTIQAAMKRNKGNWSTAFDLTNGEQDASKPKCSYGNSSSPWVVWKISDGSNFVIQSLLGEPGNNWKNPTTLSLTGEDAVDPRVSLDGQGRPLVVWQRSDGSNTIIQSAINVQQQ